MIRSLLRKLRQIGDVLNGSDALLRAGTIPLTEQTAHRAYREWLLLTHPRYRPKECLTPFGRQVYSQFDEDGILAEIFSRLGIQQGTFVEFGVEDGMETNSSALLQAGWSGVWIEGSPRYVKAIQETFATPIRLGRLTIREAFLNATNIEATLRDCGVPVEPTLLSVDIDGNDFWVWQAIRDFRPLVVVVEYNADFGERLDWVMPYDPDHRFPATRYYGASLKAFERLGAEKGYKLVGCNFYGNNAFFVRDDQRLDLFLQPFTAEAHYEPARFQLKLKSAWPRDRREFAWRPSP